MPEQTLRTQASPVIAYGLDMKTVLFVVYIITLVFSIVLAAALRVPIALLNGFIAPFALRALYKGNSSLLRSAYVVNTFFAVIVVIITIVVTAIDGKREPNENIPLKDDKWITALILIGEVGLIAFLHFYSRRYCQYLDRMTEANNKNKKDVTKSIQS